MFKLSFNHQFFIILATTLILLFRHIFSNYKYTSSHPQFSSLINSRESINDISIGTTPTLLSSRYDLITHKRSLLNGVNNENKDILNSSYFDLIKCYNQSQCIQPILQLQTVTYNVYYCTVKNHDRFYFTIREGLLSHPNIHLVDDPENADYLVYLPCGSLW